MWQSEADNPIIREAKMREYLALLLIDFENSLIDSFSVNLLID